jgi:NADPH2:quinone reductase
MRAVWYERTGPAHAVLEHGEMPRPEPGPGEVRVRLAASGVNPSDCNRRGGRGFAMEYPRVIPYCDGAGTIDAVGGGVSSALVGRRVWLYNGQRGRAFGTAAEAICLDAGLVSPLPDALSFEQGACLGIPGMTAWVCVFLDGPVDGQTVVVHGGAGAVGHFAVQFACWAGARVIATVSGPAKADIARAGGADATIDYTREDVARRVLELTGGQGADRVIEVDFAANLAANLALLRANGTIAVYASRSDGAPAVPMYELMRRNLTVHAVLLPGQPLARRQDAQRGIGRWLAQAPRPIVAVSQVFPLARTADAHVAVEAGGKQGTVVVRCDAA